MAGERTYARTIERALDDALVKLAAHDARKHQIVELKYFGGLTDREVAQAIGVSAVTVRRDIKVAGTLLHWQMSGGEPLGGAGPAET